MDFELYGFRGTFVEDDSMEGQHFPAIACEVDNGDGLQSKLSLPEHVAALDAGAAKGKLRLGLFSYPVLQAADILLYGYVGRSSERPV